MVAATTTWVIFIQFSYKICGEMGAREIHKQTVMRMIDGEGMRGETVHETGGGEGIYNTQTHKHTQLLVASQLAS